MIGSPFDAIHANAWQESLDVPSLNARASNHIRSCIDMLRKTEFDAVGVPKSTSLLLLGPAGSGKTHLFTRLRRQIGCRAIFVHTRPEIGVEPAPRHVLSAVIHALRQPVFGREERQIDVVVGTILSRAMDAQPHFPLAFLTDCLGQTIEERETILEKAISQAEDQSADVWPEYLGHLLRLPFADRFEQRALWTWLSGGEPSQLQLERLGRQTPLRDDDVLMALRTLGVIATFGAPLLLVFDQLENLADNEGRTGRISQYARLVSELRDTARGFVIVQMALDSVWKERIHSVLQPSMRDRLEEHVQYLENPTPEERVDLLHCWVNALPPEQRMAPFPYPFTNEQLESWKRAPGMTPRMLMQACGEAYRAAGIVRGDDASQEVSSDERLEGYWQQLLQSARAAIDDAASTGQGIAAETIRAGLLAAFMVTGINSETTTDVVPSLMFQMENRDVLVTIAQHSNHRALAKTLRTALEHAKQRFVVVVREQSLAIPPTWKEVNGLTASFESETNALWLLVDRESLAQFLAMERLLTSAKSQDFTDMNGKVIPFETVLQWAAKNLRCREWTTMQSILERPREKTEESSNVEPFQEKPIDVCAEQCDQHGAVAQVLRKLKIASIERLVREIRATHPVATRASVMSELARMRVKRFGGSVIALEDIWA